MVRLVTKVLVASSKLTTPRPAGRVESTSPGAVLSKASKEFVWFQHQVFVKLHETKSGPWAWAFFDATKLINKKRHLTGHSEHRLRTNPTFIRPPPTN